MYVFLCFFLSLSTWCERERKREEEKKIEREFGFWFVFADPTHTRRGLDSIIKGLVSGSSLYVYMGFFLWTILPPTFLMYLRFWIKRWGLKWLLRHHVIPSVVQKLIILRHYHTSIGNIYFYMFGSVLAFYLFS